MHACSLLIIHYIHGANYFCYADTNFVKLLKYRFKRLVPTDTICDIYDGSIYKERADFFSSQYNLSFILNYDGAPKFKSSSMQIWPIQLKINELPPILRYMHNPICIKLNKNITEAPNSIVY